MFVSRLLLGLVVPSSAAAGQRLAYCSCFNVIDVMKHGYPLMVHIIFDLSPVYINIFLTKQGNRRFQATGYYSVNIMATRSYLKINNPVVPMSLK
ncbi:hypothetical protein BDV38DRAFT_110986 [Aspergillus pseudotamarii]|uniref:Secreted protein n=1 Tax=Aspergillus pseudotamarii TaxID=132259 RepID=A0A5N6SS22_ASPPS|nr:uncharacterized protein BDV38DRAFT_110986 [Aspergillus pseudotamarii]KAE8136639.1 hypothetical protein BDV38DRAFT_110986 [Aspergillus pseudotamarii]